MFVAVVEWFGYGLVGDLGGAVRRRLGGLAGGSTRSCCCASRDWRCVCVCGLLELIAKAISIIPLRGVCLFKAMAVNGVDPELDRVTQLA